MNRWEVFTTKDLCVIAWGLAHVHTKEAAELRSEIALEIVLRTTGAVPDAPRPAHTPR